MIEFTCNSCKRPSRLERYFSGYDKWCTTCYRRRAAEKARSHEARYSRLKYTAKKIDCSFNITLDDYRDYMKMDCHYCGYPVSGRSNLTSTTNTGAGLDRKDPSKGYVKKNVVPSCFMCNRAKSCWFTYEEMLEIGKAINKVLAARS